MSVDLGGHLTRGVEVGVDHVEGARGAAPRREVDEDGGVVAANERAGEVEPPDAEIDRAYARGESGSLGQTTRDLDAEGVIAEEDVFRSRR